MSVEILDSLRYRCESDDLDFKQAQYRFTEGTEANKAEMLKDILALANAWREGPAYIVLGFKDRRPHPAEVIGIDKHLDDAHLQQFVNAKVTPRLMFRYEEHVYEGKTVALISIAKQKRPFYISNAYGKLKSNVVYVRRGSSTSEAEPTEAIAMAAHDAGNREMKVDLAVQTPDNLDLPEIIHQKYLHFTEKFPDYQRPTRSNSFGLYIPESFHSVNTSYWRETADFLRFHQAQILIHFVLINKSQTQLTNAKLEILVDPLSGQELSVLEGNDVPEEPRSEWNIPNVNLQRIISQRDRMLIVDESSSALRCTVRYGTVLPGERARSPEALAVVPQAAGKVNLRFRILAAELPTPVESEKVIETIGEVQHVDFQKLKSLWYESKKASLSK